MLSNLRARIRSREGLLALVAQGAVTWGSNHLAAVIAGQAEQLEELALELIRAGDELAELEAERDTLAFERDQLLDERNALAVELADLRILQAEQQPAYPTSEDVAPLTFAVAEEQDGAPSRTYPVAPLEAAAAEHDPGCGPGGSGCVMTCPVLNKAEA